MDALLTGFAEGVFVEILWDIEQTTKEGRRKGERSIKAVWWKGEVLHVRRDGMKVFAKIKYDAMAGFQSQVGDLRVFPQHMLLLENGEVTELRWRYYECSGEIIYSTESAGPSFDAIQRTLGMSRDTRLNANYDEKLDELTTPVEDMEQIMLSERVAHKRISGKRNYDNNQVERLRRLLRQKLAIDVKKPLVSYKQRRDGEHLTEAQFDYSCAGSMKASVDCTIEDFEALCVKVRSTSPMAFFRTDGRRFIPSLGCLPSVGVAEILFCSITHVCSAIGISQERDLITIAKRERYTERSNKTTEAAIRVAGTFFVDSEVDSTPSAILICRELHEGIQVDEKVIALKRETRKLDPGTVWYAKLLREETLSVSSLLRTVYPPSAGLEMDDERRMEKLLKQESNCFALRWKPLANPDAACWTRGMLERKSFSGYLEIDIPYVLIRAMNGLGEIKELVSKEYIMSRLCERRGELNIS